MRQRSSAPRDDGRATGVVDERLRLLVGHPGRGGQDGVPVTFGELFQCRPLAPSGIVDLPNGDWWGFSMMDMKSVGRLTYLSPVTWKDGWPYFGVEGNLGRSPRTWFKPDTGVDTEPKAVYERDDDFSSGRLKPIWQWNHIPVSDKWKITKGKLRLYTLPARSFMFAKNTLTQRAVGPESTVTVEVDARALKEGDVAGLALLNTPYYWIGWCVRMKVLYSVFMIW